MTALFLASIAARARSRKVSYDARAQFHEEEIVMTEWSFNRRDFLGLSGGFAGALLGSRVVGGQGPNAHADPPGTSTKPVPPPDLTGRDGIPFVDCSKYRAVKEDLGRYIYL